MKKIIKIIVALFLGILMTFSIAGCNAAQGNDDEVLKRLDALQTELQTQNGKIDGLQTNNLQLTEKLEEMQTVIEKQQKEIDELEFKTMPDGKFYSLREAYENGFLTVEELKSIAYYHHGGRNYNEEIMGEDYTPLPKTPEALNEEVELKIKSLAAKEFNETENVDYAKAEGFTIGEYYGTYGNCVAVMIGSEYFGFFCVICTDTVAGVNFWYSDSNDIRIWRGQTDIQSTTALKKETEEIIKQDYLQQYGYGFVYDKYCGTYDGCYVFFVLGDSAVVKEEVVAGIRFNYNYDWEIYAWKNGQFKTIKEAYSLNWLKIDDIKSIANCCNVQ